MSDVFGFPRLSNTDLGVLRLGGNGLGNLLFTWARCYADCQRHGWAMISPTWRSVKPKNIWKNPYDWRTYGALFREVEGQVAGLSRLKRLAFMKRVPEGSEVATEGEVIVQYRGIEGMFEPFREMRDHVVQGLIAMTREEHLGAWREDVSPHIAIHVRMGDFLPPAETNELVINTRLPVAWYVAALRAVRKRLGSDLPARVFSDGRDEELAELLAEPNTSRQTYGSAVGDILGLSRGSLLIASGSTFSMWAVFVGQMPSLWSPAFKAEEIHSEGERMQLTWDDGEEFPEEFLAAVRSQAERWPEAVAG